MERLSDEDFRRRFTEAMEFGAGQYADVIARLDDEGLPAHFTQTGGMNAALQVQLETGQILLITDAEDALAWSRDEHQGWGVGLFVHAESVDRGPTGFVASDDSSIEALLQLLREILLDRA